MKVAIVILNYNGKDLLSTYLESVLAFQGDATVWIVDNNSTDESLSFIKKKYPKVKCLVLDDNYGYAGGYNRALSKIDADLYCLLNNDIEVSEEWVPKMQAAFENDPQIGFAQSKIVSAQNNSTFDYAGGGGGQLDLLGFPYCRGRYLNHCSKDIGQYDDHKTITWASGAAFWVRKTTFNDLGGFDEDFFMHFEEIDLCVRGKVNGWTTKYIGDVKVAHLGGGTLHSKNPRKLYFNIRNSMLCYSKVLPLPHWIVIISFRLIFDFLLGVYLLLSLRYGHLWAIVKAHHSFFGKLPKVIAKRTKTIVPFQKKLVFWLFFKAKVQQI